MKQHISPKQLKEITKVQFYTLLPDFVIRNDWSEYHHKKITIGKMIEILIDRDVNVSNILKLKDNKEAKNLCNILWIEIKKMIREQITHA
jgi:hypothetical protein